MTADLLAVVALVGSGTVAGVLFAVALSMVPALMAMSPERYLQAHRLLGRNWDPTMPVIVLSSTAAAVALAVLSGGAGRAVYAGAAVALLGVSVVSHLANVPINRRMREVEPDAVPPDWVDPRPVWRRWHLLRTVLAMLALTGNAVAAMLL